MNLFKLCHNIEISKQLLTSWKRSLF